MSFSETPRLTLVSSENYPLSESESSGKDIFSIVNKVKSLDEKVLDTLYEEIDLYEEKYASVELWETYNTEYRGKPQTFFSSENLKKLHSFSLSDRLNIFALVAGDMAVTPTLSHSYFLEFPQDLVTFSEILLSNGGTPTTSKDSMLYSLSAHILPLINSEIQKAHSLSQYQETNKRREIAPQIIMEGFSNNFPKYFEEFSEPLKENLSNVLSEAGDLIIKGNYFINSQKLFTKEYNQLTDKQQIAYLNKILAWLQYEMVFEETMNSGFTEERVTEDNQQLRESGKVYGSYFHNPAHSMIYKTNQPFPIYNRSQDYFASTMNNTSQRGGFTEEYPYHRLILAVLEKLKDTSDSKQEDIEVVLDFWSKNRNPIFANAIAQVLSSKNPETAAGLIMERIKNEKGDKRHLTALLYRLEVGKINISTEGAQYLQKIYDLQEYNNPNGHIERLTNEGEIGVFNEEQELIKYFHLGDLTTPEKKSTSYFI